jgi:hypothetical protein
MDYVNKTLGILQALLETPSDNLGDADVVVYTEDSYEIYDMGVVAEDAIDTINKLQEELERERTRLGKAIDYADGLSKHSEEFRARVNEYRDYKVHLLNYYTPKEWWTL